MVRLSKKEANAVRKPTSRLLAKRKYTRVSTTSKSLSKDNNIVQSSTANKVSKCSDCKGGIRHLLHSSIVAIVIANLIWGMAAPITKLALTEIGPIALLFLRMIIASLILFPFVLRHEYRFSTREQFFIAISGIFGIFIPIALINIALPLVPSINLPIINSISPFILVILAYVFFHEKVSRNKYIGMAFGLLGVTCITAFPILFKQPGEVLGIFSDSFGVLVTPLSPTTAAVVGNLLMLIAVLFGSVGTILIKQVKHIPGHVIAFWQFALISCLVLPFALFENASLFNMTIGINGLVGVLFLGIFSSVVAYSLHNSAIQKSTMADVGLLSYVSPIGALVIAVPFLHEYPNIWFIIGSALVLFGVWFAERKIVRRIKSV